ncbi:MAG: carboxypeptidase-like regulatory domain-containing protein [Bacteroidetes bacterium]|nr:carboxypeptidase-like regulatory domain-containing protein [Bacteroidota bacterium]HET6243484.1 TonB-dependent receptor [Bacteroidia bacterium]
MLKQIQLLFLITLASVTIAKAQVGQGGLKGKVLDKVNNEPVPFANVVVELNGNQIAGVTTDIDGNFFIKPLSPGKYDVKASFVGYEKIQISGVVVSSDQIAFLNIKMSQGIELATFEKVEYEVPLISKDKTSSGGTVTREEIAKMPGRSAEMAALTVGGIYSADGERGSVRGAREDATDTYIDGVKVRGAVTVPNQAIEQVTVIMGGVPAQYGDATGGIISITTRGASSTYFGGVELISSQLTDAYGYNLMGYTLSGPLLMKNDPQDSTKKKPLVGFFFSGELKSEKDPRPSAIGSWKVNEDKMQSLRDNPSKPVGTGFFPTGEFVRTSDMEQIKARQNVSTKGAVVAGKIDINTSTNTHLTLGGTMDYGTKRTGVSNDINRNVFENTLFNSDHNPLITENVWRVYTNFTHRFTGDAMQEESASVIKNAYYSLQLDYSKNNRRIEDPIHKDKIFNYGHIGKFNSTFVNYYTPFPVFEDSTGLTAYVHENFQQTAYEFEPGTSNPILANYTQNYYDLYEDPAGHYENPQQVIEGGGLLNGRYPMNKSRGHVYDIWNAPGMPYNGYSIMDNSQFRVRATGSADIKNHAILVGFEYEQRSDRFFNVTNPYQLWQRARDLANLHIQQRDVANPEVVYTEGNPIPTITYKRFNNSPGEYDNFNGDETQSFFDYNLRGKLNLDQDGLDFLDVDSYDPSLYTLDMFSANELLNEGYNFVSYAGYNHKGERLKGKPSFDGFFNDRDEFGNLKREIGAFQPIYIAGYIQDKFAFEDLIFNVGLRVDRFDANQFVLKDPYSLFETRKAAELPADLRPSNIGDNFVVYTSDDATADISEPNSILGYRDGDKWYNAKGIELNDPSVLLTSKGVTAPWLLNPDKRNASTDLTSSAFTDYTPQVIVMPRIAFSFPISDEALFFAHYDVLAKRPGSGLRLDPTDYLFLQSGPNSTLNNPNLKPEKTITYELGFQQKLTYSSSLKFSAFYNEMRDMVQVINVNYAYPRTYRTYGNMDFGTVKGMTIVYDLRRTGNISLRASYTLQFADGTGSSATTGLNMINAGQPNLRTAFPLEFDQRHNFTASLDFRFGKGKNYNGPVWFDKQVFSNTGLNVLGMAGSGTPYSQQSNISPEALVNGGRSVMKGSMNGSRNPGQMRLSLRLDKDIDLQWGKEEEKKKKAALNVYLWVQNVLNTKNVINVYRATGNPDDDGFLNAAEYQQGIQQQNDEAAYRELYALKVNNPRNYSMPRTIRLGVILSF